MGYNLVDSLTIGEVRDQIESKQIVNKVIPKKNDYSRTNINHNIFLYKIIYL